MAIKALRVLNLATVVALAFVAPDVLIAILLSAPLPEAYWIFL